MSRIGNVSLDRENKRLKLAIKQSETEKLEWKKRHEEQTETLQAVLKENNVLHETIRLKNSIEESQNDESVVIDKDECQDEEELTKRVLNEQKKNANQNKLLASSSCLLRWKSSPLRSCT